MSEAAVVGAGLGGLTAALRLAEAGYRVEVFERYPHPGGLARAFSLGGERLEAFYHHLFTTDVAYLRLADELGLGDAIEWRRSKMGIWTEGRLWDFGTPRALLAFAPLGLTDKLRFALSTLRLRHTAEPARFESTTAADWLRHHQGERALETVWAPLLRQKFGEAWDRVAMVWLWRKLYLRGRSRSASGLGERLGYMRGSFARLAEALAARLEAHGGVLRLAEPVRRIERTPAGLVLETGRRTVVTPRVVVATALADYLELAGHLLPDADARSLRSLRSTAAICTVLELDRPLTSYYWLNVADPTMPFGGLIEHTNFVSRSRYGGRHVLYISKYLAADDPLFSASRRQVLGAYLPALRRISPSFDEHQIRGVHHFRAASAQPIVTVGYRELIPEMRTPVDGLYLCTMAQIYPEDRGQTYAIELGERVARALLEDDPDAARRPSETALRSHAPV